MTGMADDYPHLTKYTYTNPITGRPQSVVTCQRHSLVLVRALRANGVGSTSCPAGPLSSCDSCKDEDA